MNRWKLRRSTSVTATRSSLPSRRAAYRPPNPPPTIRTRWAVRRRLAGSSICSGGQGVGSGMPPGSEGRPFGIRLEMSLGSSGPRRPRTIGHRRVAQDLDGRRPVERVGDRLEHARSEGMPDLGRAQVRVDDDDRGRDDQDRLDPAEERPQGLVDALLDPVDGNLLEQDAAHDVQAGQHDREDDRVADEVRVVRWDVLEEGREDGPDRIAQVGADDERDRHEQQAKHAPDQAGPEAAEDAGADKSDQDDVHRSAPRNGRGDRLGRGRSAKARG